MVEVDPLVFVIYTERVHCIELWLRMESTWRSLLMVADGSKTLLGFHMRGAI